MKKIHYNDTSISYRNDILNFAAKQYQTVPDYPWHTLPDYVVLRHVNNKKWYGLIMNVSRERLGLSGDGNVDILDLKCDPQLIMALRMSGGFLPAYHMHHENWITVLLDGTVDIEKIYSLLEMSFDLTSSNAVKSKNVSFVKKAWIVPANPKYYDLEKAFSESERILWKQSGNVSVGDIVCLYVAAPVSAICYRCEATEVDIPYEYEDKNVHMNRVMRLKLLNIYDPSAFSLEKLKGHGIYAIRGPRYIPNSLLHELERCVNEQ